MAKKTANLLVRISPEMRRNLEILAKQDERTISSFVRKLIKRELTRVSGR